MLIQEIKDRAVSTVPFKEFERVGHSISNLSWDLYSVLEKEKADEKLRTIRSLAHDLKAPLARLSAKQYVLSETYSRGKSPSEEDVSGFKKAKDEIANVIRQMNESSYHRHESVSRSSLVEEIDKYVADFESNSPISREIKIETCLGKDNKTVRFPKKKLYKVLDNLISKFD